MTALPVALNGQVVNCTVTDRDTSVDISVPSVTVSGLAAGKWRLRTLISSSPVRGSGKPVAASVDSGSGATSVTLTGPTFYHAYKDFENSVACTVNVVLELLSSIDDGVTWVRNAVGSNGYTAAAAHAPRSDQRLGVNIHPFGKAVYTNQTTTSSDWTTALNAAKDLGFTTVQFSVPWYLVETASGVHNTNAVALLDGIFTTCGTLGLDVVAQLGGVLVPQWAKTGDPGRAIFWNGTTYQASSTVNGPTSWANYESWVTWFVNRYLTQRLVAVQGGNEPNNNGVIAADAVAAQSHLYTAAKAASGTLTVLGAPLSLTDTTYLQAMYTAGFKGTFDALTLHLYPVFAWTAAGGHFTNAWQPQDEPHYGDAPGGFSVMTDVMDANADASPVWIGEFGVSTGTNPEPTTGTRVSVGETEQGAHLAYICRQLCRSSRVNGVFLHTLEDTGVSYTNPSRSYGGNFGLLYKDLASRKPAYQTVKTTVAAIKAGTG